VQVEESLALDVPVNPSEVLVIPLEAGEQDIQVLAKCIGLLSAKAYAV
jgi:hypothetical protein